MLNVYIYIYMHIYHMNLYGFKWIYIDYVLLVMDDVLILSNFNITML